MLLSGATCTAKAACTIASRADPAITATPASRWLFWARIGAVEAKSSSVHECSAQHPWNYERRLTWSHHGGFVSNHEGPNQVLLARAASQRGCLWLPSLAGSQSVLTRLLIPAPLLAFVTYTASVSVAGTISRSRGVEKRVGYSHIILRVIMARQ